MTTYLRLCLILPAVLIAAGCATTASRIQKNQELFDSFPVAAQARIRSGQIDLGFTEDMVRIAMGDPQRKRIRRSMTEKRDVWLYTDTIQRYQRQHADIDGMTIYGSGGSGGIGGTAWINVLQEREVLKLRVEFLDGRVVVIEEPAKDKPAP